MRHYLNFEVRHGGELTGERFQMDIPDAACWLRLERRGNQLYAMTSEDAINWKSYEPLDAELPPKVKVGVEVVNSASNEFACDFERFAIYQSGRREDEADKPEAPRE